MHDLAFVRTDKQSKISAAAGGVQLLHMDYNESSAAAAVSRSIQPRCPDHP